MSAESWALTESNTNMNEAQHAWTNHFTGTDLLLLEAILSAEKLDFNTLEEINLSLWSGALKNSQNSLFEHTHCQLNREWNKMNKRKVRDSQNQAVADLRKQTADAEATVKELRSKLREIAGPKSRAKRSAAESSSSGCAAPIRRLKAQARSITDPYPVIHKLQVFD
ncbi:hypothetical protein GYMLUDRAFT_239239 [Collybiopsis luxurians FD-317 M1]|nr:hypothetical protein GYMLUDRAFT_239239 [Collybiopsis luxurians FD-317 M1]